MKRKNVLTTLRTALGTGVCAALILGAVTEARATTLADYSGSVGTDFSFAAYDGNVTPTADGIQISVSSGPDTFGGTGTNVSILASPVLTASDTLTLRAKLGPDNSTDFVLAFREASNEFFSYSVPASAFNTNTFEDYTVDLSTFFFNGDTSDGIPNDAVIEVSVQNPFGGMGGADIVVQSISTNVPEPASIALLGLAGLAAATMRRR